MNRRFNLQGILGIMLVVVVGFAPKSAEAC